MVSTDKTVAMTGFFDEVKRRKVYRVAAAYIIAAGGIRGFDIEPLGARTCRAGRGILPRGPSAAEAGRLVLLANRE